jgi:hypothetical protein
MARQAIQYVIKTLKEGVMTVQRPIPPVTAVTKYDSCEDNLVTLTTRMPRRPHKADDYDECPLCSGDGHGVAGDGVTRAAGCPGEWGSDEEKGALGRKPLRLSVIASSRTVWGFLRWQRTCSTPSPILSRLNNPIGVSPGVVAKTLARGSVFLPLRSRKG